VEVAEVAEVETPAEVAEVEIPAEVAVVAEVVEVETGPGGRGLAYDWPRPPPEWKPASRPP
jgi:hypothetical protein